MSEYVLNDKFEIDELYLSVFSIDLEQVFTFWDSTKLLLSN